MEIISIPYQIQIQRNIFFSSNYFRYDFGQTVCTVSGLKCQLNLTSGTCFARPRGVWVPTASEGHKHRVTCPEKNSEDPADPRQSPAEPSERPRRAPAEPSERPPQSPLRGKCPWRLSGPISRDTAILSLRYPISRDTFLGRLALPQNGAIPPLGT